MVSLRDLVWDQYYLVSLTGGVEGGPSAGSSVWVVAILNVDTVWAMSGLRGLGCAGG